MTKTCTACKETKSIEEFHKRSGAPDGKSIYCKPCARSKVWKNTRTHGNTCIGCGGSIMNRSTTCHPCRRGALTTGVWKGGRTLDANGYVMIRIGKTYVAEHRAVMEGVLGRPLTPMESVHHINGVRDDNRPENLQLRTRHHGFGITHRCLDCGSSNVEAARLL